MCRKISGILAIIIITLTAALLESCAKPVFELANLSVTPQQIVAGETVSVSLDVKNTGGARGDCPVVLKLDGIQSDQQVITVEPGISKGIIFTVTGKKPGSHNIDVNGQLSVINVLKPAEFRLGSAVVLPAEVQVGQEATVSVDVNNTGEVAGACAMILKVDGMDTETKEITVGPSATSNVSFSIRGKQPGVSAIDINGASATLKVLKPADVRVSGLYLPPRASAGSAAAFSVTVSNAGEVAGECQVTANVDGKSVDSTRVIVNGGVSQTVGFTVVKDETGAYPVEVNGLSGTLVISGDAFPILRVGDSWTYNHLVGGISYKRTDTVVGDKTVAGRECYRMSIKWEPLFAGMVSDMEWQLEKVTREKLGILFSFQSSGQRADAAFVNSISRTGATPWRLTVGNEWSETEIQSQAVSLGGKTPAIKTTAFNTKFRIESIESITVPAGTFECFKIVFLTSAGQVTEENWYSLAVKNWVKCRSTSNGESFELASYKKN